MYTAETIEAAVAQINSTIGGHFGTGYEFHVYDNRQDDIGQIFDLVKPRVLRFPGGTQTEQHYDPSDPDKSMTLNPFYGPFPIEQKTTQDASRHLRTKTM